MVMRNKSDSAYKKEIEKMSVAELTDTLRPFFLREVDNNYELKTSYFRGRTNRLDKSFYLY